jgi:predicted RNA-binding Zn ribbon-like protein
MVRAERDLSYLKLIGGHTALDFSNSIQCRNTEHPCEIIGSYTALVEWSVIAGLLSENQADLLTKEADKRESDTASVFERAIVLRQSIHDIFSESAAGRAPAARSLTPLNCELSTALCRRRIQSDGSSGFTWSWQGSEVALDQMLWPIAHASAELMASADLQWVRECRAHDCDRLFLVTSRSRRRQWCSMEWCGNREKARRALSQKRESKSHQ